MKKVFWSRRGLFTILFQYFRNQPARNFAPVLFQASEKCFGLFFVIVFLIFGSIFGEGFGKFSEKSVLGMTGPFYNSYELLCTPIDWKFRFESFGDLKKCFD